MVRSPHEKIRAPRPGKFDSTTMFSPVVPGNPGGRPVFFAGVGLARARACHAWGLGLRDRPFTLRPRPKPKCSRRCAESLQNFRATAGKDGCGRSLMGSAPTQSHVAAAGAAQRVFPSIESGRLVAAFARLVALFRTLAGRPLARRLRPRRGVVARMLANDLVARCPSCRNVTDHHEEGRFYRCVGCNRFHDLMAGLA